MIKARYVSIRSDEKKIIDNRIKEEHHILEQKEQEDKPEDGFVEGLQALFVDQVEQPSEEPTEENQTTEINSPSSHTNLLLEDAKKEAEELLEQARKEAEQLKHDLYETEKKKGYEDGLKQAKDELQRKMNELEQKEQALKQEYEDQMTNLEPKIASLIANMVEKLTNVAATYQEGIVSHLLSQAIRGTKKSQDYLIRVSEEDFASVNEHMDDLKALVSETTSLRVIEDTLLSKQQCMIETDTSVIDCSLDTELKSLIMDLKMLQEV